MIAIEASSPWKDLESILLSSQMPSAEGMGKFQIVFLFFLFRIFIFMVGETEYCIMGGKKNESSFVRLEINVYVDGFPGESSFTAGERMCELVKVRIVTCSYDASDFSDPSSYC